jgi:hypothetical protein
LRISAIGYDVFVKENVVVSKGELTSVTAEINPVAELGISVTNLSPATLANSKISYKALDAEGKDMPIPASKTVFVPPTEDQCLIVLAHVPTACRRVRIEIAGYKTIEVDVTDDQSLMVWREIELQAN